MAEAVREAWVTGIGIVSCLGEGPDAHWQALNAPLRQPDVTSRAPYIIHQLAPLDLDKQIPKKGDQRQMEAWQRIGTYAAGLALDSAGVKGNADVLSHMDMIVAAGGGERDLTVDGTILTGLPKAGRGDVYLNERLMSDLRPTLFLAQLSNLLAGNISIVHGVTGSSRTFMGEESAGVDAVRIALSRITAGQSDIALVGGSNNGDRPEQLALYEFGGYNLKGSFAPVWEREQSGGFALGSFGAFLVIELEKSRKGARRQAPGPADQRAVRPHQPQERRHHAIARAPFRETIGKPDGRPPRGDFRRDRREIRHRRRTRLPRPAPGGCRTRHGQPYRSRGGAAVRHECRDRGPSGQPWYAVSTLRFVRP